MKNEKVELINTNEAPAAIGPYSQALKMGDMLFCSGQIPLDPKTGQVVTGDIKHQTLQVLKNIKNVLKAARTSWPFVLKSTLFVKDLSQFLIINEVYESFLKEEGVEVFPARSTVEVARLPKEVLIEIEVLASVPTPGDRI